MFVDDGRLFPGGCHASPCETDTAFAAGASTGGGMRDRQVEALVTAMASFGAANFDAVSLAQNIASLRRDFFVGGGFARLF